jgi:putative component of membrane protein insertase Oxa1/YidC/SpoIIIJ protein YidD
VHIRQVLSFLGAKQLFVWGDKCQYGQGTISYLAHVISKHGVAKGLYKIQAMVLWPNPSFVKALKGFLGLIRCYRKFIKGYGPIASSLTQLLKKDSFDWMEATDCAFSLLK